MGNHEYCEDCGENSYHLDRQCDPVKVAARRAAEALAKTKRKENVERMKATLEKLGIPFHLDEHQHARVYWWDFEIKEAEVKEI